MNKLLVPPPLGHASHPFTVENMKKMAEELLNDPELGRRSRVVSAFSGDGHSARPPPEREPDQLFDFDYIIISI